MEELVEGSNGEVLAGRFKGFAEQEIARGVVGDSQRKAVPAIAELELAPRFRGGRLLKSAHQRSFGAAPVESGVPVARCRGRPGTLTRPCRWSTTGIVLLAGTRISPSSRRTRSSRILPAPQCVLSRFAATIKLSICTRSLSWQRSCSVDLY